MGEGDSGRARRRSSNGSFPDLLLLPRRNREAWQVRASVDWLIRCVNRNRAGVIVYDDAATDKGYGFMETDTLKRVIR
jgi:hypothetical protein